MQKQEVNWSNYSDKAVDFILSQATKLLEESIKAYRETTNKCYAALTFYTGIIAYCLSKVLSTNIDVTTIPYFICLIGNSICIFILYETLKPTEINLPGSQPVSLLIEYFEKFSQEEQDREYKEQVIVGYNNALIENEEIVKTRSDKFIKSIKVLLTTFFLSIVFYSFFSLTKCH